MKTIVRLAGAGARRVWLQRHRAAFHDTNDGRTPRLFVDVSVIMRHDAATGIQRVVRSVWSHLEALRSPDFDVIPVYAGRSHGYCYAPIDFLSRRQEIARVPVGVRAGDKFLGLDLAAHYLPDYVDQLSAWRAVGASLHFVVYDLLPLSRPDWFESRTGHHFQRWFETVVRHADQALCISDDVAQEFRRRIVGTPANDRVDVGRLHLSGDIAGSLPSGGISEEVRATLERVRARPTVLMVGTVEPRKAYDKALGAFERLWAANTDVELVIIGKSGWKTGALQERIKTHAERGRRLRWLEDVSDEALTQFYEASRGLFLASYDEGFGLPVVEAATHRRWALVRVLPVFRDQGLPNLRFFRDDCPEALSRELTAFIRSAECNPPPPASLPDWEWCVRKLVEEIGLTAGQSTGRTPVLRLVS